MQRRAQELHQLQRAVAGEHLLGFDALPFGQPAALLRQARRSAVLQDRIGALRQHGSRAFGELGGGIGFVRGHAAGEVDGFESRHGSLG